MRHLSQREAEVSGQDGAGEHSPCGGGAYLPTGVLSDVRFCDPMGYSLPGSFVYGILQARILEWVAVPSSRGPSRPRDQIHICVLHWQVGSLPLAPPGKPKNTGVVAISFSRGSSPPRDGTQVSCASPALQADFLPATYTHIPINKLGI